MGKPLEDTYSPRDCARSLFSFLMLSAAMLASWLGWNWDGGLVDTVNKWEREHRKTGGRQESKGEKVTASEARE